MKSNKYRIIFILAMAFLFTGCSTLTGKEDAQLEQGSAQLPSVVTMENVDEGAAIEGAQENAAWAASPLHNPNSLLYGKIIYFDYDLSSIRTDSHDLVIAHGEYLATNPAVSVTVEGHADERGSREYNIALGERRANAVKQILLTHGVADHQITSISYGEERPAVMSSNEAAWAGNRRVELVY